MVSRVATLAYGIVAYICFLGVFLYAVGFVGNLVVPKSIDSGAAGPTGTSVLVNVLLLGLFAVQHSVMARPAFKRWWTRFVPRPIERSTYVIFTSVVLTLLYWLWMPIGGVVWQVQNAAGVFILQALFWIGWVIVLASSFMIDHFELFGLRQTILHFRGREAEPASFKTPVMYRYVRHPLMLGFLIAFWAAPTMTVGHMLFAAVTTVYILIAIQIEERDLQRVFGAEYDRYRQQVSMLVPISLRPAQADSPDVTADS